MKVIHVVTCILLCLLATPASAQTAVADNEVFQIPSHSPWLGKADHSTIAVNDRGDVFVTWSSSVYWLGHPYAQMRRVEGAYLRRTLPHRWVLYPTVILGEAKPDNLPGGTSVYANGDNCRKPDVVAVGNDFIVAWQRLEIGDSDQGQMECARIQVDANGHPEVQLKEEEGIGFILDPHVDLRAAGGMVDLAHHRESNQNDVVAVYVSRKSALPTATGVAYDFELRAVSFEFQKNKVKPQVKTPRLLDAEVAFDDFVPGDPIGGRVLADAVFDKDGNLVVAYEDFRKAVRFGEQGVDAGKICLARFQVHGNGKFTQLNHQEIVGSNPQWAMRRPNLIRTDDDTVINLAFGERQIPTQSTDVYHYRVEYPNATADATLTDLGALLSDDIDEGLPIPLQLHGYQAVVICADPPNGARRITRQAEGNDLWHDLEEFDAVNPWRPALDVLREDPVLSGGYIIAMTVEGRPSSLAYSRIFCEIITP